MNIKITEVVGVPEVQGEYTNVGDFRYRLWTVEHLRTHPLLAWRLAETGPRAWVLCTRDGGWQFGISNVIWNAARGGWDALPDGRRHLAVYKIGQERRHEVLDDTVWSSEAEIMDALWQAGIIGLHIYDSVANKHGLLDAAIRYENAECEAGRLAQTDRKTGDGTWDYFVYDWEWLLDTRAHHAAVLAGKA